MGGWVDGWVGGWIDGWMGRESDLTNNWHTVHESCALTYFIESNISLLTTLLLKHRVGQK